LCDWFGINDIFCSSDTVDCYNLKVVQSSMGSIARVKCHYIDLSTFLSKSELTIYGATLNGISHYDNLYNKKGILVLGSESHGISPQVLKEIDQYVTINSKGVGTKADSLNVATATAILLGEVFRP